MLCCFGDASSKYSPFDNNGGDGGVSHYPGRRNNGTYQPEPGASQPVLMNTGGNALTAYNPSKQSGDQKQLVSVTVPEGVSAGQTLHITAPDGSGRMIAANVPPGMQPGGTFMVEFASAPKPAAPPNEMAQFPTAPAPAQAQPLLPPAIPVPAQATVVDDNKSSTTYPKKNNTAMMQSPAPTQNQSYVQVHVPPGAAPGSTIHVQIPGENRTVAAVVPPGGASQFHVAYTPNQGAGVQQNQLIAQGPAKQQQQPMNIPNQAVPPVSPPSGQSLIMVKVPPGTAPGTTLHVKVPGLNRTVTTAVPPGVSEFHVAYTPQNRLGGGGSQHQMQQGGHQQFQHGQQQQGYNNQSHAQNGNKQNSGFGSVLPMVAGGALLGAAGLAMYGAAHHEDSAANENNYENDGGGDDWGGGGGDY